MKLKSFLPALLALALAAGAHAESVIRIGAPLALTGGLADEGKKQQIAYDMWLKRVNDAGGIQVGDQKMKVELITYDYQSDEKRAQQMAERLITQDRIDFMTAPFGSGHTKVVAGVAERYGVPVMASVASSESVFNQGYKYLFGTLASNAGLIEAMIKVFGEQMPNARKIAILGREDVFPRSMATAMQSSAKSAGLEIVHNEFYPVGALDHSASLSKIKASGAEWIYITGYTKDLILARKQMADLGVTAPIVTMVTGPAYQEFIDGLDTLANGVSSTTWWHHSTEYTADDVFGSTKAFYEEFVAREKHDPDYVHASAAAAMIALQKAIEKAGTTDKAKVRDALAALDIETFYGPIKFGANGMNGGRDLPIIQVQNKKVVVLFPTAVKQADAIAMP